MRRISASQRRRSEGVDRIDAVLRRLSLDGIRDAGFRIDPVVRRDLTAASERDEHAVGDVVLREAQLLRARAIDFDVQLGRVHDLVQANVDRARDLVSALASMSRAMP